jgi:GT2 family glycosyltransferase
MKIARRDPRITHFWLLNNDTVVESECLTNLKTTSAKDPTAGLIGALQLYYDQPDTVLCWGGATYSHWIARAQGIGKMTTRTNIPNLKTIEKKIGYVQGASIFLPVAIYDRIGPMYEGYFLYYEELDWARLLPKPYRMTVALDAVVYHKEGSSMGTSSRWRLSDTSIYYTYSNLFRYMWRCHRPLIGIAYLKVIFVVFRFLLRRDVRGARVTIRAMIDAHVRTNGLPKPGPR